MIDGGRDYLKVGGKDLKKVQFLKIIKTPKRKN
jgi:hypothetical protein